MIIKPGKKAPNFKITNQSGELVELSQFLGKKVVLYFYPKDMTSGCTAQSCNLRDNYKKLKDLGFEVIGISTDTEKSHQKFIEKEKLPFQLLADTEKTVHELFNTWIEKSMYGRKYMGTARTTFLIDENGIVSHVIDKVNTKNHTEQILKVIEENDK